MTTLERGDTYSIAIDISKILRFSNIFARIQLGGMR